MKWKVKVIEVRSVLCEYYIEAETTEDAVADALNGDQLFSTELEPPEVSDREIESEPEEFDVDDAVVMK